MKPSAPVKCRRKRLPMRRELTVGSVRRSRRRALTRACSFPPISAAWAGWWRCNKDSAALPRSNNPADNLGRIPLGDRLDRRDHPALILSVGIASHRSPRLGPLLRRLREDRRAILRADVIALAVELGVGLRREEHVEQVAVAELAGIEGDADRLDLARRRPACRWDLIVSPRRSSLRRHRGKSLRCTKSTRRRVPPPPQPSLTPSFGRRRG